MFLQNHASPIGSQPVKGLQKHNCSKGTPRTHYCSKNEKNINLNFEEATLVKYSEEYLHIETVKSPKKRIKTVCCRLEATVEEMYFKF
jgi:hypothetical protein